MNLRIALVLMTALLPLPAFAATDREPAPAGSPQGAPPQFTRFTAAELTRGFVALAFGSDLRVGAAPRGIRRFDRPIALRILDAGGNAARAGEMKKVVEAYAAAVPTLRLALAAEGTTADIEVRLIAEKDFRSALVAAYGAAVTREFVARTDPQCMTSVKSRPDGVIAQSISFIIVDKGDAVFFDCAYHELLHAFGLSNHDQGNPWTSLNQNRTVGYLTVYDRLLLTLLYDPSVTPGLSRSRAREVLADTIERLGLATAAPAAPAGRR